MDKPTVIVIVLLLNGLSIFFPAFILLVAAKMVNIRDATYLKCFIATTLLWLLGLGTNIFMRHITTDTVLFIIPIFLMLCFLISLQFIFVERFLKVIAMWFLYYVLRIVFASLIIIFGFTTLSNTEKAELVKQIAIKPTENRIMIQKQSENSSGSYTHPAIR